MRDRSVVSDGCVASPVGDDATTFQSALPGKPAKNPLGLRSYKKGRQLFRPNETSGLWLIQSGQVAVGLPNTEHTEWAECAFYEPQPGTQVIVGAENLFGSSNLRYGIVNSDDCKAGILERGHLLKWVNHPTEAGVPAAAVALIRALLLRSDLDADGPLMQALRGIVAEAHSYHLRFPGFFPEAGEGVLKDTEHSNPPTNPPPRRSGIIPTPQQERQMRREQQALMRPAYEKCALIMLRYVVEHMSEP